MDETKDSIGVKIGMFLFAFVVIAGLAQLVLLLLAVFIDIVRFLI